MPDRCGNCEVQLSAKSSSAHSMTLEHKMSSNLGARARARNFQLRCGADARSSLRRAISCRHTAVKPLMARLRAGPGRTVFASPRCRSCQCGPAGHRRRRRRRRGTVGAVRPVVRDSRPAAPAIQARAIETERHRRADTRRRPCHTRLQPSPTRTE